uniref:CSN8/PSMD8/EIF3K domain-containing protein n=1 Tax=Arcella intermedia TaxID=1963864 RepID=A0A6B2LFD0_9EUKA
MKALYEQPYGLDPNYAKNLITKLKILLTHFAFVPPALLKRGEISKELFLARQILEYSTLMYLKLNDVPAFERSVAQLKTYYSDYGPFLPESAHRYPILGVYLLHLLAENKIGEFHTELELIQDHANRYVNFSIQLEQYKMEGRYNKVWGAGDSIPVYYYEPFVGKLMQTARNDIGDSLEVAYDSMSLQEARKLLMFGDEQRAFQEFVTSRNWRVADNKIIFTPEQPPKQELGALQLIAQSLKYAHELERII